MNHPAVGHGMGAHDSRAADRHDAGGGHGEPHGSRAMAAPPSLNRVAFAATLHCLTGCSIGEIAGMVIGSALGWGNLETIALAFVLAFVSGYALTVVPLLRAGMPGATAARVALAADTASITVMEIVDNLAMWLIPGAMDAGIDSALFWVSMGLSLAAGGLAAYPINRWLIARGQGHALAHDHHR